ncbi:DNA adenine methylase [Bradyrhizobium sp. UFLA05-153]
MGQRAALLRKNLEMKTNAQTNVGTTLLHHFTPLRYPGGKGKLASFVKAVIKENGLFDGEYVEPYAGGAAVALELLFHDYVSSIHVNDLSRPVFAFWNSVLNDTERLCKLIKDTPLTMREWDRQRFIFSNANRYGDLRLGFATFFLNRTNRSGILNGGVIGGRDQAGPWKIDARFNKDGLMERIESIAKMRKRINLTSMDACTFLRSKANDWPPKTLVYLDPPYFAKGRDLYYDYYHPSDHAQVAAEVPKTLGHKHWIVSYDNVPTVRTLYSSYQQLVYRIGYSARDSREGMEIMFFSDSLKVPKLVGPISLIRSRPRGSFSSRTAPPKSKRLAGLQRAELPLLP